MSAEDEAHGAVRPLPSEEELNGRALGRELARLRRFEDGVTELLGKPREGTDRMLKRIGALVGARARLELATAILTGKRIDRNPIVLLAAADAVQERALAVEGRKLQADHEIESFGIGGDSGWLERLGRELRDVERELRDEASKGYAPASPSPDMGSVMP